MQFAENIQANWQEEYSFIMTIPDPHTARATHERIQELHWEFLEHLPYTPDLAPSDFHLCDLLKTTLLADVSLMMKRLKWVRKYLRQQSKGIFAVGFRHTGKAKRQVYQWWWRIC
jgi:hypothetical protein